MTAPGGAPPAGSGSASGRMRAVLFFGPKQIRLVDVPVALPGPGQVLVRVGAALTCGTDFKAYRQGHRVLLGDPPAPFGHELAGTVVAAGPGAGRFTPGMRVVAANSAPCDGCFFCERGQSQLCEDLRLHNGAYAEYNLVPERIVRHNLYELPPGLDFQTAALAEPLACAIHAADVMSPGRGDTVAILGAGNMALLLIEALKPLGCRVLVAGRGRGRLATAREAGAERVHSSLDGDPVAFARQATGGLGPDVVIEAVGTAATWEQSLEMVRRGGRVCLFGGCAGGTRVPVDAHKVHYGQISLHGVFHHTPRYFRMALDLLARGSVRTDLLITDTIGLGQVPSFFERSHERSNPKVAVIP